MKYGGYIGYLKYEGSMVSEGLLDARKSAGALLGLDSALKFFVVKQIPELKGVDFEVPVRLRKGSWEALIPDTIGQWLLAGLTVPATAYATKAAQKMADRDFDGVGLKDVFRKSFDGVKWVIRIGKHVGDVSIRKFQNVRFVDNNSLIGIPNESGEYLYVPKEFLDFYVSCSPKLIEQIVSNVEHGRKLIIGTVQSPENDEEEVSIEHKHIFCKQEEDSDDVIFPELQHGDHVVLDGEVTSENKSANSMGFKYMGHILTTYPVSGNIVPYKPLLFLRCRISGYVSRIDEKGQVSSRKPKIIFNDIESIEGVGGNMSLFE